MACSNQAGVAPFLQVIQVAAGEKVTQADWHAIRALAEEENSGGLTRTRATSDEAINALGNLQRLNAHLVENDEDMKSDYAKAVLIAEDDLRSANVTKGTVLAIEYLAQNGTVEVLAKVREDRKASKTPRENARTTVEPIEYPEYSASICSDCLYMSANGWGEEVGRELPDPAPLSNLPRGAVVSADADEDGNYKQHFSNSPCQGCGSTDAGGRVDVTVTEFGDKEYDDALVELSQSDDFERLQNIADATGATSEARKVAAERISELIELDNNAEADLANYDNEFNKRMTEFQSHGLSEYDAARAAETELFWEKRVRAFEEEGIPTSDAQAMVDAEDMLAGRETAADILRRLSK